VEQDRLKKSIIKRPDKMIMPGTIFVKFSELSLNSYSELVSEIHAQINIYNPSEKDYVKINSENVPLIKDFITPFSIFQTASIKNIFFHKYARVFCPNKYSDTGIYMISPVCHNKIPVIFL